MGGNGDYDYGGLVVRWVRRSLQVAIDFTAIAGGVGGYTVLECRSTSDGVKSTARAKGLEESEEYLNQVPGGCG